MKKHHRPEKPETPREEPHTQFMSDDPYSGTIRKGNITPRNNAPIREIPQSREKEDQKHSKS